MRARGPAAVVGLACVFPGAPDVATFWDNVVEGRDSITEAPPDRLHPRALAALAAPAGASRGAGLPTARGGFVSGEALDFEPARFGVMPVAVDGADPDHLVALKTAAAAFEDAGELEGVNRERVGVVLGRGGYLTAGLARIDQRLRTPDQLIDVLTTLLPDLDESRLGAVREAFEVQLGHLDPEASFGIVPNLAASRIANRFDFGGPAYTIDGACASSLLAVDAALSELAAGRCDAAVVGGVHHSQDVTLWSVFSDLGALSQSGVIRPFSRHADGVLLSEGTGVVVLERLADAERLGHRVYAVVRGAGAASDGRHASLMSPRVDGQLLALRRAYEDATLDPSAVRLVEGHGTATPAGDGAELETLRRFYHGAPPASRVLGSVKSNIGHALPAAGAAGLIKAVLAVHHGVLPPTLHAEEPNPALGNTTFRLLQAAEDWTEQALRCAGVNAFGFGGVNAHVVLEQHRSSRPPARAARRPQGGGPEAVLLEGRDAADLSRQLAALVSGGRAAPSTPASAGLPARLAIVGPAPRSFELAERVLSKGQPWRGRSDIWFEPTGLVAGGGRVAFLFPGVEPTARAQVDDVARHFRLEVPTLLEGAQGLERHGRDMFETGRLLHRALGLLGAVPDDVAGHSLGEWTATFVGELIPAASHDDFLEGLEPGSLEVPGVIFLALGCGAAIAEEVIEGLEGVVVSHDNCPHQSVICGPEKAMGEARRRFADRKLVARELPYRSGFHTPYFEPYLGIVRRHWARMPLQPARIPVWSATTCDRYPADPEAVRALAAEHLVRPVRFRELVGRMHDDGVRVFVQLGVGSLVAFADDALRDREHLSVVAASSERAGLDQLARAAAALWVEGVDVAVGELLLPRPARQRDRGGRRAARSGTAGGPTIRLSLGAPFVKMPDANALRAATAPGDGAPRLPDGASSGLRSELDALLSETMDAVRAVSAAIAGTSPPEVAARGTSATGGPKLAGAVAEGAAATRTEPLVVDVEHFPWIVDHAFFRQPAGWRELSDRFPVLPMTTMIGLLAEAAVRLVPGTRVASIEHMRAMRWLVGAPATHASVSVRRVDDDVVAASIDGFARATVRLVPASTARAAPAPSFGPLQARRSAPFADDRIYSDHWMFHGPAFQGIRAISAVGDDGIDGIVVSPSAPMAWLDNAGQLCGLWIIAAAEEDSLAFPQSIERIDFFGPEPPVGAVIEMAVRVTEMTARSVRSDLELTHEGAVLARITGWADRRFDTNQALSEMMRWPEHHLVAVPCGDEVMSVDERWGDSASRELMARRYLDSSERAEYEQLNPALQRFWLLARMAAKDAVRQALWDEGHGPLFPIEVPLVDAGDGVVAVRGGPGAGRRVAVAHAPWIGVASLETDAVAVECVEGEDESSARARLAAELARKVPPGSPIEECARVRSSVHGKEYLVARTLRS